MFGNHGRYLRVDATSGTGESIDCADDVYRRYVGGVGLATWLTMRELPAGADPLGPEAALSFVLSPLVGSPLTTSAKFAIAAKSPLTGRFCDALSSSRFAIAAKRAGIDALTIVGKRPKWSVLLVDGLKRDEPAVRWLDAEAWRGQSAGEAEEALRRQLGPEWQIAAIGPGGERLIPFATISHDGRHAGRGGLGAVLGSKRIKAVAIRGDRRVAVADPTRLAAIAKDLSARSFGPATAKYRELGTVANLLVFNRFEALPTRNYQSGHFDDAERLAADELAPARRIAKRSCAACTIGCEHIYPVAGRPGGTRLEYESMYALGPLCGVSDPEAVLKSARRCDEWGLDTITTGATIAFLAECVERGWIDGAIGPGRRQLAFGDGESILEAIDAAGEGTGLGELVALGSRRAAERIGGEAPAIAPHVKGLELPGYDPRALHAMALGLAVAARGADHNRSGAYEVDFSGIADRRDGGPGHALPVIAAEDKAAVIDSLILCKFLRGAIPDLYTEAAGMLAAVTGDAYTGEEVRMVGARVVSARRAFNTREGATAAEDTLPPRLFSDQPGGLTADRLAGMIAAYYQERGWTPAGEVPEAMRRRLDLESEMGRRTP